MTNEVYTYRAGKKVQLEKQPDQFVVRALPEELRDIGISRFLQAHPVSRPAAPISNH